LFIEWPTAVHKVLITTLTSTLDKHIVDLPYPDSLLDVLMNQNTSIKAPDTNSEFIPDTSLSFFSKLFPCCHRYQLILKVAFTQTLADVLLKVKEFLNTFPEVLMVVVVNITEARPYQSPAADSMAWNTFQQDSNPLDLGAFITPQDSLRGMTVNSGGHMWCSIKSIDYHVWMKSDLDGNKIDIDVTNNKFCTWGVSSFNDHM